VCFCSPYQQASADRAQTHLFESNSQAELRVSALQSENSILAEGSSRADAKIAELQREIDELSIALSASSGASRDSNPHPGSSGGLREESSQTLQLLVSELQQDLRRKEEQFRMDKQKLEAVTIDLNATLSMERQEVSRLTHEVRYVTSIPPPRYWESYRDSFSTSYHSSKVIGRLWTSSCLLSGSSRFYKR
jgi:hypothetical protein